MPLIPLRPLLETVDKYHFAQGAFNVNAVAQAKAAIEVHEMFRSAAILQGADLANGFMGGRTDFQNPGNSRHGTVYGNHCISVAGRSGEDQ